MPPVGLELGGRSQVPMTCCPRGLILRILHAMPPKHPLYVGGGRGEGMYSHAYQKSVSTRKNDICKKLSEFEAEFNTYTRC